MELRPYQEQAIAEIRANFAQGVRVQLLHLATGGGKTHIFSYIIKRAAENGKKIMMVVRGRQLVEQASQRLFREHVPHGVRMAGAWNRNYGAAVQVCSIDTLISRQRKEGWPKADIIVIDEAHLATSDGYQTLYRQYPEALILMVTATPYTDKPLGAQAVVHPITMQGLVDIGFLVPFRYFAPSDPELAGIKIVNKDYQNDQLEEAMNPLTGDILDHWERIGEDRPTIGFAVNVRHSKMLTEMFCENGIPAEHVEAATTDNERRAVLSRLEKGTTKVVFNVGILCTGVDMPYLGAIIMARPTKSYNLFIQQAGRGTRIFDGKSDCILLDHAGNVLRHGFPTEEPEVDLNGKEKTERNISESKVCKQCYAVYRGPHCPACGAPAPKDMDIFEVNPGQLQELKADPVLIAIRKRFKELDSLRKEKGYKKGYAYYRIVQEFNFETVSRAIDLPQWFKDKQMQQVSDPFRHSPFKPASG